jgi:hypothetical protein
MVPLSIVLEKNDQHKSQKNRLRRNKDPILACRTEIGAAGKKKELSFQDFFRFFDL